MKKIGWSTLFVVCVFVGIAAYRLRGAPTQLMVALVPIFALSLFLITANPTDPNSFSVRVLKRIGFHERVQTVHASTQGGGIGGMIARTLAVIFLIAWFLLVMNYWPA